MADHDLAAPTVEARLYRYAGCDGWVKRWFIVGDRVPLPFFTRDEAMQAWLHRQHADERRRP